MIEQKKNSMDTSEHLKMFKNLFIRILFICFVYNLELTSAEIPLEFNKMINQKDLINKFFWDENGTRYQLVQTNNGLYNWLFFPGGPGADSSYFLPLINELELPGSTWLIDFPGNGTNIQVDYSFDQWSDCLLSSIKKFKNPIYIGHSFGGCFPLLFPELENLLEGFVIISGKPSQGLIEIKNMRTEKGILIPKEPLLEFKKNQNTTTFKQALIANAPCHFAKENLDEGKKFFENLSFNFHATIWWINIENEFNVKWIPKKVPTLILGGSEDCVNPISLFEKDQRFYRSNITIQSIYQAGHFPWIEKMDDVKKILNSYIFQYFIKE